MVKQRKVFPPQKNKERYPCKRFTALLHHMMNSIDGKGMIDHSWTSFNISLIVNPCDFATISNTLILNFLIIQRLKLKLIKFIGEV